MHRARLRHALAVPCPEAASPGDSYQIRHEKGWSIDRLAAESGVGRRTIINLEGAIKTPRIDTLYAVAVALDVPLPELVAVL